MTTSRISNFLIIIFQYFSQSFHYLSQYSTFALYFIRNRLSIRAVKRWEQLPPCVYHVHQSMLLWVSWSFDRSACRSVGQMMCRSAAVDPKGTMSYNGGKTKKDTNVRMHTKSKRMELENPGCSGFKDF